MFKALLLATTMTVGLEYHAMIGLFFLCACYELHREEVLERARAVACPSKTRHIPLGG